jgi:rubrerythrin
MCPYIVERKYFLSKKREDAFSLVQQALNKLDLKEMQVKKSVPPSYLVIKYKAGWADKREVEFVIEDRENGSEVSIKWFVQSTTEDLSALGFSEKDKKMIEVFSRPVRESMERMFEEIKHMIGARDIKAPEPEKTLKEKEIIKEKEVVVKIRCSYCNNLYDETLDKCPHCGAKR